MCFHRYNLLELSRRNLCGSWIYPIELFLWKAVPSQPKGWGPETRINPGIEMGRVVRKSHSTMWYLRPPLQELSGGYSIHSSGICLLPCSPRWQAAEKTDAGHLQGSCCHLCHVLLWHSCLGRCLQKATVFINAWRSTAVLAFSTHASHCKTLSRYLKYMNKHAHRRGEGNPYLKLN